jgi:hypothetical protein
MVWRVNTLRSGFVFMGLKPSVVFENQVVLSETIVVKLMLYSFVSLTVAPPPLQTFPQVEIAGTLGFSL